MQMSVFLEISPIWIQVEHKVDFYIASGERSGVSTVVQCIVLGVLLYILFSCTTLPVPSCHANRRKHEGWELPGCPSLERGSRDAEVGFEPWTFQKWKNQNVFTERRHVRHTRLQLELKRVHDISRSFNYFATDLDIFSQDPWEVLAERMTGLRWLKWVEREFTDRKVRGSNPTSASRLPLSRLGQPGSISALVLPSGSMAARHRKGVTTEHFGFLLGERI
ncbi:hypothetical protein CSKR_104861 [Clonorchis sinensis]|uniref:Uncharacterized protein n=1 Tax=Clonorchis sinensis TaxID=79923 RepID=A0A3R7JRP1_CLOSI|nr:hypothetical protein CSKR_104861 [Clonorchis sinensis]